MRGGGRPVRTAGAGLVRAGETTRETIGGPNVLATIDLATIDLATIDLATSVLATRIPVKISPDITRVARPKRLGYAQAMRLFKYDRFWSRRVFLLLGCAFFAAAAIGTIFIAKYIARPSQQVVAVRDRPDFHARPDIDSVQRIDSPDGTHVAILGLFHDKEYFLSPGYYFQVWVGDPSASRETDTLVFFRGALSNRWDLERPHVVWSDERHLVITLSYVARIARSLHQAGDVTISYHLADTPFEETYRLEIVRREGRLGDRGSTSYDEDTVKWLWAVYAEFEAWVRANVNAAYR